MIISGTFEISVSMHNNEIIISFLFCVKMTITGNKDRILVWEVPIIGPPYLIWLHLAGCHSCVSGYSIIKFVGIQNIEERHQVPRPKCLIW